MTTLTERQHTGEFLVSEANGSLSRETGTLAQRSAAYVDGTVLSKSGNLLIACEADTDGVTDVVGILYGYVDASGGNTECVYIDRLAEVKDELLTYPDESTAGGEKAAAVAGLLALNIKTR